jgi:hypothetical protein
MNVFTPGVREPAALLSARTPPSRLHAFNAILHVLHGFYKIRAAIPFDLLRRTAKFHLLLL